MIIKTLTENTSISDVYGKEHGLSLYIETNNHKILFDMGKTDLFYSNSLKIGADISAVDLAVISHGHCDHGGGLNKFLQLNLKASVFAHKKAFEAHYSDRPGGITYIGLDTALQNHKRLIFSDEYMKIDDEAELFSGVSGDEFKSVSNKSLLIIKEGEYKEDPFYHEQNLIITENGKTVLFAGCAHNGIINIIEKFKALKGKTPDVVIGGFHLCNPGTGKSEASSLIKEIGERLYKTGCVYYTCHCTDISAFQQLKRIVGEKMNYLAAGSVVEL